jgi:hypothetical protein
MKINSYPFNTASLPRANPHQIYHQLSGPLLIDDVIGVTMDAAVTISGIASKQSITLDNGSFAGIVYGMESSPSVAGTETGVSTYGIWSQPKHTGSGTTTLVGSHFNPQWSGSGTLTHCRGVIAKPEVTTGKNCSTVTGILNWPVTPSSGTITLVYGYYFEADSISGGTNRYASWIEGYDTIIDGDGNGVAGGTDAGCDLFFGEGQDAAIFYDGTDLVVDPRVVGSGAFTIGTGAAGVDYVLKFNGETNDITLTAMEDEDRLDISSNVDIAQHLALGADGAVSANAVIDIDETSATNASKDGIRVDFDNSNAISGFGAVLTGIHVNFDNTAGTGSHDQRGFDLETKDSGTGGFNNIFGIKNVVNKTGSTNSSLAYVQENRLINTDTITTTYGLIIDLQNSGTITTNYAIFIDDCTDVSSNGYAFWTNEGDVILDGDGNGIAGGTTTGCDLFLGEGQDAAIYYDGTQMVIKYQAVGTGGLMLLNASSTPGTPVGGPILYNKNDGELYVKDTGGNETPLSPHDGGDEWIFQSTNKRKGKRIRINMEKFIKTVQDKLGIDLLEEERFDPEWD